MPALHAKEEYLDVSANMRLFINMRFAQLTLFVAITAALLNVLLGKATPVEGIAYALKICGLVTVLTFWVLEERAADFFHYYKKRAKELEPELGMNQYSKRPERNFGSATNAVRFFFLTFGVLWLLLLFCPSWFA